jgi:ribosome-interacting GTPase 1
MTEAHPSMPANLTAEAKKKWDEVAATRDSPEKLKLLQEFLTLIPKHKGSEKLQKQTKRQIATLRRELEEKKQRKVATGGPKFFFEKEGAAQIIILGPTKVGRSSLLASITNAKVEISDYPFTTLKPVPGMFAFEDIQFQIIEAPPLMQGAADGENLGTQILGLARNADGIILMVDASQDTRAQLSMILNELEKAKIAFQKPHSRIDIERKFRGAGLRILLLGRLINCNLKDVEMLLRSYRIVDAVVRIQGDATLDSIEDAIFEATVYRPAIVIINKMDSFGAKEELEKLAEFVNGQIRVVPVSCKTKQSLESLGRELFNALGIIRIYTKEIGVKKPSPKPFILKRGATVQDLAKLIHSDFFKRFSSARVWSKRLTFSPQKVGLAFILDDKDIIAIQAK